jgi:predicted DsbA family dithiol-disulfide isomerase
LLLAQLFQGRGIDLEAMHQKMKGLMDAEGLPYSRRERTFNSRLAQELGKFADSRGVSAIHDALYRAYFVDGANIARIDVLLAVAERGGLPRDEVEPVLRERRMRAAVDADWERSRLRGVTGVPTFAIGNAQLVGAQPYDALARFALEAGAQPRRPGG